jgi:hypothetical protein
MVVDPAARPVSVERQGPASLNEGADVVSFSFGDAAARYEDTLATQLDPTVDRLDDVR